MARHVVPMIWIKSGIDPVSDDRSNTSTAVYFTAPEVLTNSSQLPSPFLAATGVRSWRTRRQRR